MRYLERYELRLYICRSFQIAMQMHVFMLLNILRTEGKVIKKDKAMGCLR